MRTDASTQCTPLLEVLNVRKSPVSKGLFAASHRAVATQKGSSRITCPEEGGCIGQSGGGKSTLARLLLRQERLEGGGSLSDSENFLALEPYKAPTGYCRRAQRIFQDSLASLNPTHAVAHSPVRPLVRHRRVPALEARKGAVGLLRAIDPTPRSARARRVPCHLHPEGAKAPGS
jgi:ABC-type glutathione transport system ATPase component